MDPFEQKDVCKLVDVADPAQFQDYKSSSPSGLKLMAEKYGDLNSPIMKSVAGDFRKWMDSSYPEVNVEVQEAGEILLLRSGDIWMPMVYLASDVVLPTFLKYVANYLFYRWRGSLKGEENRVHFKVMYEDQGSGIVKEFNFEGGPDALAKTIKKFDANRFFDE